MTSCFSLVSFYGNRLHRSFISSGLCPQTIEIDSETTISFWSPVSKSIEKQSLILLHGFGPSSIWQWRCQVKALSPHFNLYIPDLIFFGKSTTKSSQRSEVFQATSIGKLLETLGVEKYSVIGTSYGGFVAYNMAKLFEERVDKVVIASSGINKRLKDNMELLERAKEEKIEDLMLPKSPAQMRKLMALAVLNQPPYMPEFLLNDFINNLYSDNLEEKKELLHGLTFGNDDQVHVSPLKQEVLIVWGEHDQIFPLVKAIELKEILGEKARLEVIKKASHMPQVEDYKKFNEIAIKFISRPKALL
ncbi:hypothetical protein ACHQM5_001655 [Ranunculus cassubicifolius]